MSAEVLSLTCVQCPMGCPLEVTLTDGVVTSVTGNTCPRGKKYGEQEAVCPERVVTTLVDVEGDFRPMSVKTSAAVPREVIPQVLAAVRATTASTPIATGDIIVRDVCGTGADVVATASRA